MFHNDAVLSRRVLAGVIDDPDDVSAQNKTLWKTGSAFFFSANERLANATILQRLSMIVSTCYAELADMRGNIVVGFES